MHLEWPRDPETGIVPYFGIDFHVIDYFLSATDGLEYPRRIRHGSPSIIIRGPSWWGHFGQIDLWIAVHEILSILSDEAPKENPALEIGTVLSAVPPHTVMRDEHGRAGNTVSFLNRSQSHGIGVRFHAPYFDDRDYQKRFIHPDYIQEANLLVKPQGSDLEGVRTGAESIVFATVSQMHAIMRLARALEEAGCIGDSKAS